MLGEIIGDIVGSVYEWDNIKTKDFPLFCDDCFFTDDRLPYGLSIDDLKTAHKSIPGNPLLAESLYLNGTIEQMGTGTEDIINLCTQKGLKQPEFIQDSGFKVTLYRKTQQEIHQEAQQETHQVTQQETHQVTHQVKKLLSILDGEMSLAEIMNKLMLKDRVNVSSNYIQPALKQEFIGLLYPNNPKHRHQKYRITQKGKSLLDDTIEKENI